jgi:hypothetical protein
MPHIRNDDGIWGLMVRFLYPHSPIGRLPFAISHDRGIHPPVSGGVVSRVAGAGGFILNLHRFFCSSIKAETPEKRLASLGAEFINIAGLPEKQRRLFLTELFLQGLGEETLAMEKNLDESGGAPSYWRKDLKKSLETLQGSFPVDPGGAIPREFARLGNAGETLFLVYLERWGELLCAWPEIWKGALAESLRLKS